AQNQSLTSEFVLNTALVKRDVAETFQGEIVMLDREGGIAPGPNAFEYEIRIQIKGTGENLSNLYFSEEDLGKVKIVRRQDNQETPIGMEDLVVGDNVLSTAAVSLERTSTGQFRRTFIEGNIIVNNP